MSNDSSTDQAHRQAQKNPETPTEADACSVLRPCSPVGCMEGVEVEGLGNAIRRGNLISDLILFASFVLMFGSIVGMVFCGERGIVSGNICFGASMFFFLFVILKNANASYVWTGKGESFKHYEQSFEDTEYNNNTVSTFSGVNFGRYVSKAVDRFLS